MPTTNYFFEAVKLMGAAVLIDALIFGAMAIPIYHMAQRSAEVLKSAQETGISYLPISTFTTNHIPLLSERGFKIRKLESQ